MDGIMLSHDTYNRIMQAVDQFNTILPSGWFSQGKLTDDMREKDLVWIHNNTGADIAKGTPVKFAEPPNTLYTGWASELSLDGTEATENSEIAGVTIEEIPSQSVGLVKVNGLCIVSGVTINSTTDTHVTIDSGGNLTTAAGGPLVILGTLTAINTFYGGSNCDIICNLTSRGGGGIALGTFNADMQTTDATGDINFDAADNPDNFGGLNGTDADCENTLDLSATSGDIAVVWTNDAGDVRRILNIKGAVNRSYSNKVIGTLNSDITAAGGSTTISPTYADHPDLSAPYSSMTVNNDCKKVASSGAVVVVIANHDLSRNTIVEVEC